ncbi:hypothetical protein OKW21_004707 [Catalinimonas alkaloidigena]|uniref:glycoside hydrolase family 113 n=1 Tax=Catalinimonas alkaloidigena TaxID=1075417 RepID=UPI0024072162|nr:hypothetical protein [Catalinimonas alkaloidigena]MDF9799444.1 hypothetical protein [Catalinimonas alkaloidigena]
MTKPAHTFLLILLISFWAMACESVSQQYQGEKINGVCFVAPRDSIPQEAMVSVNNINADWIAIVPYAFSYENDPKINYDTSRQWWGETKAGVEHTVRYAKNLGLKVMLKPHVWIRRQGWPGDFDLKTEEEWQQWEQSYTEYLDIMTDIAVSENVEMICIGTEYRIPARERPDFWRNLSRRIRERYSGQLTYAANWDNFEHVAFWDELDYIGIDAYFPLSDKKNPSVKELLDHWEAPMELIDEVREEYNKPILLTEYGYRSADFASRGHWHNEEKGLVKNMKAQETAYEALYQAFWHQPWFAGGFLWKWYPFVNRESRWNRWETDFTPQEKSTEEVIKHYYSR